MNIELPTYAECDAVPPEKRTALERFIDFRSIDPEELLP